MRIGYDLDGVGFDFADSVVRYLKHIGHDKLFDMEGYREASHWYFYRDWRMTDEQFVKYCHDGADAGFIFCGGIREGFYNATWATHDLGHTNHIVTDRSFGTTPEVSEKNTLVWLASHMIPYDTITFSADKTVVPVDIFIEDKLQNYDALTAAGTECWLINRLWNLDPGDSRNRVDSLSEFVDRVKDKSAIISV